MSEGVTVNKSTKIGNETGWLNSIAASINFADYASVGGSREIT